MLSIGDAMSYRMDKGAPCTIWAFSPPPTSLWAAL